MRLDAAQNCLLNSSAKRVEEFRFNCLDAFLDFIADLSADEWLAIGAAPPVDARTVAILEATLAVQRLQVDSWCVRDDVETLAVLVRSSLPPPTLRVHHAMERARLSAERAALAILARRWLARSDVADLLSPFSSRRWVGCARAP